MKYKVHFTIINVRKRKNYLLGNVNLKQAPPV